MTLADQIRRDKPWIRPQRARFSETNRLKAVSLNLVAAGQRLDLRPDSLRRDSGGYGEDGIYFDVVR